MLLQQRSELIDMTEDAIEIGIWLIDVVRVVKTRYHLHAVLSHELEPGLDLTEHHVVEWGISIFRQQHLPIHERPAGRGVVEQRIGIELAQVVPVKAALGLIIAHAGEFEGSAHR